ncbi:hypothetical protein DFH07DRAFT_1056013 [Mycena maculata]|uniref:Uncharacterized protein n=1 Tax=Mycena maculata TaxID=230809 RepID=A0AAD7KB91_9AGAR|nr:hypothetical protein DFH07DRAFT_1056013 [Mycena maculata]
MSNDETPMSAPPFAASLLAFESPCARPGCSHIFRYDGGNPLDGIAALVKAHRPHCAGHHFAATHKCATPWAPSIQTETQSSWAEYNGGTSYFGDACSMEDIDWASGEEGHICDTNDWGASNAIDHWNISWERTGGPVQNFCKAENAPPTASSNREFRFTYVAGQMDCKGTNNADELMHDCGSKISTPIAREREPTTRIKKSKPKKTARKEAERKAVLVNDPWTGLVEYYRVVCRGCGNTIMLDARSRFYPGLWEKHRGRCDGVKSGEPLPDLMIAWDPKSARGSKVRDTSETTDNSSMGDGSESVSSRSSLRRSCPRRRA